MADEEVKDVALQTEAAPAADEVKQDDPPEPEKTEEVAAEAAPAEEPKTEPESEKPAVDWREREIKSKHRQNQELKRALDEKELELARLRETAAKFNQPTSPVPEGYVPQSEVDRRAAEKLAQERYMEECNRAAHKGQEVYKEDWKSAVDNLEMLGGFDQATMNGVLATDDAAKVIYELGKNPDHYHRIMAMPLERRIIEMGKLAMSQQNSKPISAAPAPVSTVGGRPSSTSSTLADDMPDDKWYQVRLAQKRKKFEAAHRR